MRVVGLIAVAVLVSIAIPIDCAWADVIDGEWCSRDGRHMSINGPNIVTPAGAPLVGTYSRHSFKYVIPNAEANAGQTVFMILVNEQTVNLRIGPDYASASQAPVEVWHRCTSPISRLQETLRAS